MLDFTTISLIAGFAFVVVVSALLGAGPDAPLTGMFPDSGKRDWPQGVQEMDVPRFAVEHLDALRPLTPGNRLPGVSAMPHAHAN